MAKGKKNKAKYTPQVTNAKKAQARDTSAPARSLEPLTFGKKNYMLMLIGFAVIIVGLLLMSGGAMTDPNVWDEGVIYSFRRITLAPIVIVIGLAIEIYAIFK